MVENLIAGYLATGKRLVIPDLGAFLKKDTGETVFVEFLKKDDGVLSQHVSKAMGITTLEAAGIVSQFTADVKTALGAKGFYIVPNVGTLRRDSSGNINLTTAMDTSQREPVGAAAPSPEPIMPVPVPEKPQTPAPVQEPASRPQAPLQVKTEPQGRPVTVTPSPAQAVRNMPPAETPADPRPKPVIENYTPGKQQLRNDETPRRKPVAAPAKKKTDLIMVIAVIAALIAIGAMIYGLTVDSNPINSIQPTQERLIDNPVDQNIEVDDVR